MNLRYFLIVLFLVSQGIISYIIPSQSLNAKQEGIKKKKSEQIYFSGIYGGQTRNPLNSQLLNKDSKQQQRVSAEKEDTLKGVKIAVTVKPENLFIDEMVIQIGAFRFESYAKQFKERLSYLQDKPIIIVPEGGYFKVRLIDFKSLEEMDKIIPALGLLGVKEMWIFRVKKKEETKDLLVAQSDTTLKEAEKKIELPVTEGEDPVELENPVVEEPTINLLVVVFQKRSKALRARRRISTKLNLPVEIVPEWGYYKVIITGFKKIEEISKYYPMLSELGYPITNMNENNPRKK
jgi:hypothetical protein